MMALKVCAASVAAYMSSSVSCKSLLAQSLALNLVRKLSSFILYLKTYLRGKGLLVSTSFEWIGMYLNIFFVCSVSSSFSAAFRYSFAKGLLVALVQYRGSGDSCSRWILLSRFVRKVLNV
ncbi:hypothetical protein ACMFMG_010743 [Clarireedia jacksonii]